jgi:hypothetical protein
MIWDILVYIPDDVKILRRSSFHLTTACFISSRYLYPPDNRGRSVTELSLDYLL